MSRRPKQPDLVEAQRALCTENNWPLFMPADGWCWNCRQDLTAHPRAEEMRTQLVTGCWYCCRSYCD